MKAARTEADVLAWLETQGYALEYETAAAFRASRFQATLGKVYTDSQTNKLRDIDVVAEARGQEFMFATAHLYAIIECKSATRGAWVIRADSGHYEKPESEMIATGEVIKALKQGFRPDALPFEHPYGFAVVEAAPDGQDAAFGAIAQAVSAAKGWIAQATEPSLAVPIVVLDGPIFMVTYTDEGLANIEAVSARRVPWSGPGLSEPTPVDLVQRSEVPEYARSLRWILLGLAGWLAHSGMPELRERR